METRHKFPRLCAPVRTFTLLYPKPHSTREGFLVPAPQSVLSFIHSFMVTKSTGAGVTMQCDSTAHRGACPSPAPVPKVGIGGDRNAKAGV